MSTEVDKSARVLLPAQTSVGELAWMAEMEGSVVSEVSDGVDSRQVGTDGVGRGDIRWEVVGLRSG